MISIVCGCDDGLVVINEESDEVVGQPADQNQDDADQRNASRVHLLFVPVHELKSVMSLNEILVFDGFDFTVELLHVIS